MFYIGHKNAHKLAAILKANSNLCALFIEPINFSEEKDYIFSFNKIIILAINDNSSVTSLTLPFNKGEELCVLQNEVEIINIKRQAQEIPTLNVSFYPYNVVEEKSTMKYCYSYYNRRHAAFISTDLETFDYVCNSNSFAETGDDFP